MLKQSFGQLIQTGAILGISIPGEELTDDRRFSFVDAHPVWIPRMFRIQEIPIRLARPRQQLSGLHLAQLPSAHPLADQRLLILGHRPADLQHQLIVGIITHRTIQKLDDTAVSLQLLQNHHLVHEVACQSIRSRDQHPIKDGQTRLIAKMIQTRTIQTAATISIIPE